MKSIIKTAFNSLSKSQWISFSTKIRNSLILVFCLIMLFLNTSWEAGTHSVEEELVTFVNVLPKQVDQDNSIGILLRTSTDLITGFSIGCTPCYKATPVSFTNLSTGAISYHWDFGDGNSSTVEAPTHTFSSPGLYIVTLTAYGNNLQQENYIGSIEILDL